LGRHIGAYAGKYPHALIAEGVQKIDNADKQIRDPQKKQVVIVNILSGIPGNNKDAKGDYNTEDFHRTVEKEIIMM